MCYGEYGGDFVSGFSAERNRLLGERQKAARAFAEFKAQNPNATYEDFRTFVDGLSGGDSYLRRAMPSDEILRRLGEEGQLRKDQEARARVLDAQKREHDYNQLLESSIKRAYTDGIDLTKAPDYVLQAMNISDETEGEALRKKIEAMNPTSMYERFDREFTDELTRNIGGLINSGAIFSEEDLQARLPQHFMSRDAGKSLLGNLKVQLENHLGGLHNKTVSQGLQTAINLGEGLKFDTVIEIVDGTMGTTAPETMRRKAAQQIWDSAQQFFAEERRKREAAERDRLERRAAQQRDDKFRAMQFILGNPAMAAAATRGTPQQQQKIFNVLRTAGFDISPTDVRDIQDFMVARGELEQNLTFEEGRRAYMGKVPEYVQQKLAEAQNYVFSGRLIDKDTAKEHPQLAQALATLTTSAYVSPSGLNALRNRYFTDARWQKMNAEQLTNEMIQSAKRSGVQILTESDLARQYQSNMDSVVKAPQGAREFTMMARSDMASSYRDFRSKLTQARGASTPNERIKLVQEAVAEAQYWHEQYASTLEDHALDQSWVTPNSGTFTMSEAARLKRESHEQLRALLREGTLLLQGEGAEFSPEHLQSMGIKTQPKTK